MNGAKGNVQTRLDSTHPHISCVFASGTSILAILRRTGLFGSYYKHPVAEILHRLRFRMLSVFILLFLHFKMPSLTDR
jgi:hypothetical protein